MIRRHLLVSSSGGIKLHAWYFAFKIVASLHHFTAIIIVKINHTCILFFLPFRSDSAIIHFRIFNIRILHHNHHKLLLWAYHYLVLV